MWDGDLFWGIAVGTLSFRIWNDLIAVADDDLKSSGSLSARSAFLVKDAYSRLSSLSKAHVVKENLDFDHCRYYSYEERACVDNLSAVHAEKLSKSECRYIVHVDMIF